MCNEGLYQRDLKAQGEISYAANHFRAILDLLYDSLRREVYPARLKGASEDYLDTDEEKDILLEKAKMMYPYLSYSQKEMLQRWISIENKPGYRA